MDNDDIVYVGTTSLEETGIRMTRSRTRSRRSRGAQKHALPVETYDLVDDVDIKEKKKIVVDGWLDITLDDDSIEVEPVEEVKALWYDNTNKIERFELKRSDPLLPIFKHFAKLNNVDKDSIQIHTNKFQHIHQYDSIETLDLKVTNFLIASLQKNNIDKIESTATGENIVEVKCQFKDRKQPIICSLHRNQPFSVVMEQCASNIGCDVGKVKLYFDGELINSNETPKTLDLDGGECIDVVVL